MVRILIALTALLALPAIGKSDGPNILLILADDLGYHDLGFQGSEHIKTPNLDWLAENGCRFSDGHVSACVCSPSRAGMMTGRYQQRFGHEGNCPPRPFGMDTNERTLGQALQDCGYRTALFGKWHLGDETQHYPTARGFDEFWGLREGSRTYWFDKNHAHDKPGDPHNIEHNGKQVEFEGHLTDRLTDQTLKFIEAGSDQPFFVFLSYTAPHGPLQSKPEDMEALGTDDNYAGLVYGMDRNIGRVFESLRKSGQLGNTIIWFLSDNGGTAKQSSNAPLGGMKGYEVEGGHRVPFVLYWKGHIQPGSSYEPMVSSMDIYPTSVIAAGGSLEQPRPLDGKNLMPYINGKTGGIPHDILYWRKLDCASVRHGPWKLIRVENYGVALYNLADDLAETKDLAKKMPEKAQELSQLLTAWEADKMAPPYDEGVFWQLERYYYHTQRFKTGVNPVMDNATMKMIRQQANKQKD